MMTDQDINIQSSVNLPSTVERIPFKEKRPSNNDQPYDDMACLVETVQNELHLCAEAMLVDYVEACIKEEVMNLFESFTHKNLKEVIIELPCLIFMTEAHFFHEVEQSLSMQLLQSLLDVIGCT